MCVFVFIYAHMYILISRIFHIQIEKYPYELYLAILIQIT